jgi:hypothetical protein
MVWKKLLKAYTLCNMSRQNHVLHYHISAKKKLTAFDKLVVIAAFAYPLSGIPQVIEVMNGNIAGVSIHSWLGFVAFSGLFLAYGIVHKITPMIITNLLWLFIDAIVVVGVLAQTLV